MNRPLDQALNNAVNTITMNFSDEEAVRLAVAAAMTKAVLNTKEECLNQVISAERRVGDNIGIIEKINEALPTSSHSTDLINPQNKQGN